MAATGRYTQPTKELSAFMRTLARDSEVWLASTMNRFGLKPPKPIRRRVHVKRALAKAKVKLKGEKTE